MGGRYTGWCIEDRVSLAVLYLKPPTLNLRSDMTELLTLVIFLVIVGFIVWLLTTYVPMPPLFRNLIFVVIIILILLYLLRMVGGIPSHL